MTETAGSKKTTRRKALPWAIAAVLLATFGLAAWYLTSDNFRELVRDRVVAELEQITGGRVELKTFRWDLSKLEMEASDLTIHGLEKKNEVPYVHVDRLYARLTIVSLIQREVRLQYVSFERPVVHIILNADGTTNIPAPKTKSKHNNHDAVQSLIDLAIARAELQQGTLLWNQRRMPLDLAVNDVVVGLSYDVKGRSYDGALHVGKIDSLLADLRPFSSMADVEFSLYTDRAQVKSLKVSSGRSSIQGSGSVVNFSNPKIELLYRASVDLGELGNIIRLRELRKGTAELNGQGTYTLASFASAGKLLVRNGDYEPDGFHLTDVSGRGDFAVKPDRISLTRLEARALGGDVRGEVDLYNWLGTATPEVAKERKSGDRAKRSGVMTLRASQVAVGQVAVALSSKKLPLDKLKFAGTAEGNVVLKWQDTLSSASLSIAADAHPPVVLAPGQVPVTASMVSKLFLGSLEMEISRFALTTATTKIEASGTMGSTKADLRVTADSANVSEYQPLLDVLRGAHSMPVEVAGTFSFNGNVSGKFVAPSLAGHVELRNFVSILPAQSITASNSATEGAGRTAIQSRRIQWDAASGEVTYSPTQASVSRGVLRRGNTQINVDAATALQKGIFTDASQFTVRAKIENADATEAQSIVGYNYPISGRLDLSAQVGGTKADPHGKGHVSLTNGQAYGQAIKSAASDIVFENQEAEFQHLAVVGNVGRVSGSAMYNLRSTAFSFDMRGTDFDLASVEQLKFQKVRVGGELAFETKGSGTTAEPIIDTKMRMRNLVINGEKIGNAVAEAVTKGESLHLTVRSNFQNASLVADGDVRLRGDMPGNIKMHFQNVTLDPIMKAYLAGHMTGRSLMAGDAELSGPIKQPKLLNLAVTITSFQGEAENIHVRNVVPLKFSVKNQVVKIDSFRLEGEETHFIEASGTAELSGDQRMNLRFDGRVNMKLIESVSPDLSAYGTATFGVGVGGTLDHPRMRGQIQIADGAVSYIDLPNGLSKINGTLVFTQDRLQVQKLTARTGGGDLQLGGFMTFDRTLSFNLTAKGTDIRLRYPPGVSATANADLTLAGTLKNSLLTGDVTVTKFGLNPRFDFALYVANAKQPPPMAKPDSPLNGLRFDVHVGSTPQLQVETSLAKVSGDVDLHLRGTGTHPVVLGRLNIFEGDVFFNGTQYHLERGDITFTNPVKIEPVLDMEASARVRDYDINLGFHGSIEKLGTTYRSDPPLPTADIIALLALGRTREESAGLAQMNSTSNTTLTESASNALLGQALNATVSSRVQKLFGVSRIKIDPQVGGPENNPNARLTIEQQVSNKITLTYITNLSQSAQQVIQVEYNINRSVSILAVRDQNGVVGFDVRIRQRRK